MERRLLVFAETKKSILWIVTNKPIETKRNEKRAINFHIELMNTFKSNLLDFILANAGIRTDEKIIGEIPVITAGTDNILKYKSIS